MSLLEWLEGIHVVGKAMKEAAVEVIDEELDRPARADGSRPPLDLRHPPQPMGWHEFRRGDGGWNDFNPNNDSD